MKKIDAGLLPRSGRDLPLSRRIVIAGPCSVESEEQMLATARALANLRISALRGGIWKPRTRPGSFQGVGAPGLKWLKEAAAAIGVPAACEVAEPAHVDACLAHGIDILWIGARTSTNPFSVQALADRLRGVNVPVMVKNPINPDIELWLGAIERLLAAGVTRLSAVHRGFATGRRSAYRNDPVWRIPLELRRRMPELAILCDPSHLCGTREHVRAIAQEALDLLYDGLMVEVHPRPQDALSDGNQQLTPAALGELLGALRVKKASTRSRDYREHVALLRSEIDELDHRLIEVLGRRMAAVREIGGYKQKYNIAPFQPDRWRAIVENRTRAGAERNLPRDFVLGLYQRIHEEAIRQQEEADNPLPDAGGDMAGGTA